ncbi:uncharacterized protein PHACADRAFT_32717 [Phanerochaete carnosa HHB-10118-sp]|uniref:DUF6534 domain-containing protein n=1 Tax=Phanerochaete carnosa (strain HHB-10118-sp) TaxID=650164 RepID=K5ULY5_PHACS|nr:uncharacterized protein PHACADRAFT_32717 [Phanerochaete carnosa HHB-10118-sp]EKM50711.1 hypothetical protein PHACADRAFT_32717 [Phanerochaete carnosa HHB-10118-sp]
MSIPTSDTGALNITQLNVVNMVGAALSSSLWGAAGLQMFLYFLKFVLYNILTSIYESDHRALKALVLVLYMADTAIEALLFAGVFLMYSSEFQGGLVIPPRCGGSGVDEVRLVAITALPPPTDVGRPTFSDFWRIIIVGRNLNLNLTRTHSMLVIPKIRTLLSNIFGAVVQLFFLWRIYRFAGKSRTVCMCLVFIAIVAMWQVVGASSQLLSRRTSVHCMDLVSAFLSPFRQISKHRAGRQMLPSQSVSQLVALCMYDDSSSKGETSYHHTTPHDHCSSPNRSSRLIYRLVFMAINTGLWTTVVALINVSLVAWRPTGTLYVVFEYPLASLYLNTLLANLTVRKYLRRGDTSQPNLNIPVVSADSASKRNTGVDEVALARIDRGKRLAQASRLTALHGGLHLTQIPGQYFYNSNRRVYDRWERRRFRISVYKPRTVWGMTRVKGSLRQ